MRITERYKSRADLPETAPVFPLRGVILLPRAMLPLNIFEPRYLEMFDDIVAGDRLVAIVQPERTAGENESPQGRDVGLRRVAGIGRLTAFQELDDGRMIVSLTGVTRCTIEQEIATDAPYRTCRLSYDAFPDDLTAGIGAEAVDRTALLNTLKAFLAARDLRADWQAIERSQNEALVNSLAMMSPYGPEEKQALLEAHDLKLRAELLVALTQMELASGGGGSDTILQ